MLTIDICRAAEQAVVDSLEEQGFTIAEWNKQSPSAADIRAVKHDRRMILQVRASIFPEDPPFLTEAEKQRLVGRARQTGDEPWEVRTFLDGTLRVAGPPQWRYLK